MHHVHLRRAVGEQSSLTYEFLSFFLSNHLDLDPQRKKEWEKERAKEKGETKRCLLDAVEEMKSLLPPGSTVA